LEPFLIRLTYLIPHNVLIAPLVNIVLLHQLKCYFVL
jgi:hypothetical protein